MRALAWLVRLVAFLLLLGMAIKNRGDVPVRFFFEAQWSVPLALVVLAGFAAGAVAGVLALLPAWLRQRRALAALRCSTPVDRGSAIVGR